MSRVLLDENIPIGLRRLIGDHDVVTVDNRGWKGLTNGRLLAAAEAAGFDVFVSADQNLRFQQNVAGRSVAVVVLSSTNWHDIRRSADSIKSAVDRAEPGAFSSVQIREAIGRRERRR